MKNFGPIKYFPGALFCQFIGKEFPSLVRWSERGSIISEILADVLRTLDALEVNPRSVGHPNLLYWRMAIKIGSSSLLLDTLISQRIMWWWCALDSPMEQLNGRWGAPRNKIVLLMYQ